MSRENVQLVERMYAALNRGNITVALDAVDPEVEWRIPSEASPAPATYRGEKEVRRALDSMLEVWGKYSDTPVEFIEDGDYVVVRVCSEGTGKASGAAVAGEVAHLWEIRRGKIVRFAVYRESDEALDAAGIDEQRFQYEDHP